ncbi:oxygen-independent coproporphyrinogen III oxidase [Sphingomonas sp. AP4-R1]|uniref:oxygen-independent coproporphyrinogen III oxidase n=1 Tax=Sphingomonas sp. AP4-R1 TaxID=2735134 RepID=UPI00149373D9|nr:oxygen-independent coproporphyrinogen III oxidase [Sphingomonas sp. AP4-R1]QJU60737.1 oxygen-independent coproporphyrinogen III oxidase [Sphingomonas sp. AP4-R1]
MWPYHPDLLARPVPRYTSYPTAAEFTGAVGHEDMVDALYDLREGTTVSLYLHIPYCREICWYCGCNTAVANRPARLDAYLTQLHTEITLVAAQLAGRVKVGRIAFGGGSPNAIGADAFTALVRHLRDVFTCDDAILSVELDPRGFTEVWAEAMGVAGVSRASLGVQTFDPALQHAIGRVQPAEDIARAVTLLRGAGVDSINFDLMYGLPGQDAATLAVSIDAALALRPERLAVFGYAHVPHMIPRQRRIDASALPDARMRFEQAWLAHERLTAAGYQAIGFDHFALPEDALAKAAAAGTLHRNFQGFTEDQAEVLIGLGASAISQFPDRLLQNEKNSGAWRGALSLGSFAVSRGLHRSGQDQIHGRAIEDILCRGAADIAGVAERDDIAERLQPFETRGLLHWQGSRLVLEQDALPYARVIAATLDCHRGQSGVQFSSAV